MTTGNKIELDELWMLMEDWQAIRNYLHGVADTMPNYKSMEYNISQIDRIIGVLRDYCVGVEK